MTALVPLAARDHPRVERFLRRRLTDSMFILSNLTGTGIPMRCWVSAEYGGVDGVLALVENGMVLPQWPCGDWHAAAAALTGAEVTGLLGPADQVRALLPALGLAGAARRHDADEPGFHMDLSRLTVPDGPGVLVPLTGANEPLAREWRAAYDREILGTPPGESRARARRDIRRWIEADSHRLLMVDDTPLAMTGFNARLPDAVQVGGVYVPPHLRDRGHARRAVALHLAEARGTGARHAVLFAVSPAAARAYQGVGFQPDGALAMILFERSQRVPACP